MLRRVVGALEAAQVRRFGRSAISLVARTPVLLLHTTGRRTGIERVTTVAYHRGVDGSLLIVGGAGGQTRLPDWVANLRAEPSAVVTVDRSRVAVTATELVGQERHQVWRRLAVVWPRIERYQRRAGRPVPVIRLTPVDPFGDRVTPAGTGKDADRVESAFDWTLLNLAGFEKYLQIDSAPLELVATIAAVAARHTSRPDSARFAIWDGYGWPGSSEYREVGALRSLPGRAVAGVRDRLERRVDHRRQDRARRQLDEQLSTIPKLELRERSYYLLTGPVGAAAAIAAPGAPHQPQPPDLWWPEDLSWFVATDVDLDHVVVGGSHELIAELTDALADRPG